MAVTGDARPLLPTELTLHRALSIARWGSWSWTAVVVAAGGDDLRRPALAWFAVALAFAVAAAGTAGLQSGSRVPTWVSGVPFALVQVVVAFGLVVADGLAFGEGHVFATSQSVAAASPTIAAIALGIAAGGVAGVAGGMSLGMSRLVGAMANGVDELTGPRWGSIVASTVFVGLWGGVAGWLVRTLRTVETEVIVRRERDDVARTLHDTVLQTLAVVARRTDDPELASLARRTDGDIRSYLFGPTTAGRRTLAEAVRDAATRSARTHGTELTVNVVDEDPSATGPRVDALAIAVGEAVMNAGKHGSSGTTPVRVVVYAESDGRVLFASVRDDGPGFDVAMATPGQGMTSSIRGVIEAVGGRIEIDSSPRGTEVRMWTP